MTSRRRVLGIAAGLVVTPLLAGCPRTAPAPTQQPAPVEEDVPDCDAGDVLEGDEDCFGDSDVSRRREKRKRRRNT